MKLFDIEALRMLEPPNVVSRVSKEDLEDMVAGINSRLDKIIELLNKK